MNYKQDSRNGDYFVREAQETQFWAAGHIPARGDESALQGCTEGKQQRGKKKSPKLYNHSMLWRNQKHVNQPQMARLEIITQPVCGDNSHAGPE